MTILEKEINGKVNTQHLLDKLFAYKPNFTFTLNFEDYEVRIAKTEQEIREVLKLRYSIFFHELKHMSLGEEFDIDEYDLISDHMILVEKETKMIVGTYRFLSSENTHKFYSESEFDITNILKLPGIKLELGRACIHPNYRNSIAIQHLWRGLVTYVQLCGARYMFGCSSIHENLETMYPAMHSILMSKYLTDESQRVTPLKLLPFWVSLEDIHPLDLDESILKKAERMIPALLKAYLRAGAQVAGTPCWDPIFNTLDYFTIFDCRKINFHYERKFGLKKNN